MCNVNNYFERAAIHLSAKADSLLAVNRELRMQLPIIHILLCLMMNLMNLTFNYLLYPLKYLKLPNAIKKPLNASCKFFTCLATASLPSFLTIIDIAPSNSIFSESFIPK